MEETACAKSKEEEKASIFGEPVTTSRQGVDVR